MEKIKIPGRMGKHSSPVPSSSHEVKTYYVARVRTSGSNRYDSLDLGMKDKIQDWGFQSLKVDPARSRWLLSDAPKGPQTFILEYEPEGYKGSFRLLKKTNGIQTLIDFGSVILASPSPTPGLKDCMEFFGKGNEHDITWEIVCSTEPIPVALPVEEVRSRQMFSSQNLAPRPPTPTASPPPPPIVLPPAVVVVLPEAIPLVETKPETDSTSVLPVTGATHHVDGHSIDSPLQEKTEQTTEQETGKTITPQQQRKEKISMKHNDNLELMNELKKAFLKRFNLSEEEFVGSSRKDAPARQVFCFVAKDMLDQSVSVIHKALDTESKGTAYINAPKGKERLEEDAVLKAWVDDLVADFKKKYKLNGPISAAAGPASASSAAAKASRPTSPVKFTKGNTDGAIEMSLIRDVIIYTVRHSTKCSIEKLATTFDMTSAEVYEALGRVGVALEDDPVGALSKLLTAASTVEKFIP